MYVSALAKFIQFDVSRSGLESAGFLIGSLTDNTLVITDCLMGEQSATGVHVELDESALLEAVASVSDSGKPIVGWIHSHPDMGAGFFSGTDIRTQNLFQSLFPHAVGVVIDACAFSRTHNPSDLDVHVYQSEADSSVEIPVGFALDSLTLLNRPHDFPDAEGVAPAGVAPAMSPLSKARLETIVNAVDDLDAMAIVDEEDRDILIGFGHLLAVTESSGAVMPDALHESVDRVEARLEVAISRAEAAAYEEYDTEVSHAYLLLAALVGLLNVIAFGFSLIG